MYFFLVILHLFQHWLLSSSSLCYILFSFPFLSLCYTYNHVFLPCFHISSSFESFSCFNYLLLQTSWFSYMEDTIRKIGHNEVSYSQVYFLLFCLILRIFAYAISIPLSKYLLLYGCSYSKRKPNESMRLIVIFFFGGFLGLFIGLSVPAFSTTKVIKSSI